MSFDQEADPLYECAKKIESLERNKAILTARITGYEEETKAAREDRDRHLAYAGALRDALESANSLCRSAYQIAQRISVAHGNVVLETNFGAFARRLEESLALQHRVMFPNATGGNNNALENRMEAPEELASANPDVVTPLTERRLIEAAREAWFDWADTADEDASMPDHMLVIRDLTTDECQICQGAGEVNEGHCDNCHGFGRVGRDTLPTKCHQMNSIAPTFKAADNKEGDSAHIQGALVEALLEDGDRYRQKIHVLHNVLMRLRAWDVMDIIGSDGPFWRVEIDKALDFIPPEINSIEGTK